jgi:hypothetical protein
MKTLTHAAFLEWAERAGLGLDPQYPHSAVLAFRPDPQHDRFWELSAPSSTSTPEETPTR